jgi:serine/threonine protein kinase
MSESTSDSLDFSSDDSFVQEYNNKRLQELKNAIVPVQSQTDLEDKCSKSFHDHFVLLINPNIQETCHSFDSVYKLGTVIGDGGFGIVVQATNLITGKDVALKIQKHVEPSHVDVFRKEINNLKELLSSCSSFVCIEGWGMYQGKMFIAMEYLQGTTLTKYIEGADLMVKFVHGNDALSFDEFYNIASQLVIEVEYLHSKGMAHTDIKPENIMIHKGLVKIIDFGLGCSKQLNCHSGGTRKYMPRHIDTSLKGRQQADWYALGLTLIELATSKDAYLTSYFGPIQDYIKTLSLDKRIKTFIINVLDRADLQED